MMVDSSSPSHADTSETKTTALPQSDKQTLNHITDSNEDKELARIPFYNGETNIYAWLIAIKSVFIDLKYDESTWMNKAKYYLLDHAAQFAYIHESF